jgi:hypothetical protein
MEQPMGEEVKWGPGGHVSGDLKPGSLIDTCV